MEVTEAVGMKKRKRQEIADVDSHSERPSKAVKKSKEKKLTLKHLRKSEGDAKNGVLKSRPQSKKLKPTQKISKPDGSKKSKMVRNLMKQLQQQ